MLITATVVDVVHLLGEKMTHPIFAYVDRHFLLKLGNLHLVTCFVDQHMKGYCHRSLSLCRAASLSIQGRSTSTPSIKEFHSAPFMPKILACIRHYSVTWLDIFA